MKKQDLLRAVGGVNEHFLAELAPAPRAPRRGRITRIAVLAAALTMLLSLSLWLFIPYNVDPPNIRDYEGSDYYELIRTLNAYRYAQVNQDASSLTTNNFDRYILGNEPGFPSEDSFTYLGFGDVDSSDQAGAVPDGGMDMPADDSDAEDVGTSSGTSGDYYEVTDNQVAGVSEADLLKRTADRLFYLDDDTLRIFSIAGADSAELGSYHIIDHDRMQHTLLYQSEMYLSADGSKVTLILPYYGFDTMSYVDVVALDVRDPAAVTEAARYTVKGAYHTSRVTDGQLLLSVVYDVNWRRVDYDDVDTYLPMCDTGDGMQPLAAGDIFVPSELSSTSYTVLSLLSTEDLTLLDSAAMLSYAGNMYATADHIYLARNYREERLVEQNEVPVDVNRKANVVRAERGSWRNMSEIVMLEWGESTLTVMQHTALEGHVLNQYSMDEHGDYFRVVTTTSYNERDVWYYDDGSVRYHRSDVQTGENANLYCLSLSDLSVAGEVIAFAPKDEGVRSVRFEGDVAYVCTSVNLSDPVYFFDLSDVKHITSKDTGTIAGLSSSLVNFAPGLLLGIGRGNDWDTLKIELYREGESGVVAIDSYTSPQTYYSTEYKSYYIDRDHLLVGLACDIISQETNHYTYLLLHFDGQQLVPLLKEPMKACNPANARGVYIDGFFYLFGSQEFKAIALQP